MSNDVLLVIGNGFDKAHGMKTDYKDVLNFIWNRLEVNYNANCSTDGVKFITRNIDIEKCSIEEFNKIKETFDSLKASCYEEISLREELKKRILDAVRNNNESIIANITNYTLHFGNIWLNYFTKLMIERIRKIGYGWIDFEAEISRIISAVELILLEKTNINELDGYMTYFFSGYKSQPISIREEFLPEIKFDFLIFKLWMEEALKIQEKDVNTREFFSKIAPRVKGAISYNYTHTLDIYGIKENVKYIHGEIGKHNLVLGVSETLSPEKENTLVDCAYFKKKYQLIRYRLGNEFKSVFPRYSSEVDAFIYGHSLTAEDNYSLRWLLTMEDNHLFTGHIKNVIIYYYGELAYDQQIANLILLIGQEKALQYVSSRRISFIPVQ